MGIALISVEVKLSKFFSFFVDELNLTDSFVLLTGPNGSGKSTFLHLLASLIKPARGQILLDGKPITPQRKRINFALGSLYYPPSWSYNDAARFEEHVRGQDALKAERLSLEDAFRLEDFRRKPFRDLSAGMLQKANLALSLIGNPKLILYDEPEMHLDQRSQEALKGTFAQLLKQDFQLLCATHYTASWEAMPRPGSYQSLSFPLASN